MDYSHDDLEKMYESAPAPKSESFKPVSDQDELEKLYNQATPVEAAPAKVEEAKAEAPPPPAPDQSFLEKAGNTLADAVGSTIYNLPFAVRAGSAIDAGINWMSGGDFDYDKRLKENNEILDKRRAQYPTYHPKIFGHEFPINGFDAMGMVGGSAVPMGTGYKIAASGGSALNKALIAALGGAGFGAAQGLSNTKDLTADPGQDMWNAGTGAAGGAVLGATLSGLSSAGGAAARTVMDLVRNSRIPGMTEEASRRFINTQRAGSPDISPTLQEDAKALGPVGTFGDTTAHAQEEVQKLASVPGPHKDTLTGTYKDRDPNAVIQAAVDDPVKGVPPMTQTQAQKHIELRDEKKDLGQNVFKPIMETAKPVPVDQIQPILDEVNSALASKKLTTPEHSALMKIRDRLTETPYSPEIPSKRIPNPDSRANTPAFTMTERVPEQPAIATTDPQRLHSTIMDIDQMVNHGFGDEIPPGIISKTNGAVGTVRTKISDALKNDQTGVPGYEKAMNEYSSLHKQRDALNEGAETVLRADAGPARDFIAKFDKLTDPEKEAMKIGMIQFIRNSFAKKGNDVSAANTLLQGIDKTGNNYQKIAHVFGEDVADNLSKSIRSARTIAETNAAYKGGNKVGAQANANTLDKIVTPPEATDPLKGFKPKWEDLITAPVRGTLSAYKKTLGAPVNSQQVLGPLTKALTTNPNSLEGQALMAQLLKRSSNMRKNEQVSNIVRDALAVGGGAVAIPPAVYLNSQRGK